MLRRRPFPRVSLKPELLETRNLLTGSAVAPMLSAATGSAAPSGPVAVGDVNGSLAFLAVVHRDLAARNYDVLIYHYNEPTTPGTTGSFVLIQTLATDVPVGAGVSIAFGDVNGDTLPDLAIAGPSGKGAMAVDIFSGSQGSTGAQYSRAASGKVIGMTSGGGVRGGGLALGDVNGDGTPDVILTNGTQVGFFLSNGQGGYSSGPVVANPFLPFEDSAKSAPAFTVADVTGDGHLDLVTGLGSEGEFLYSQINLGPSPVATAASSPFGTVFSIAIQSNGTSSPGIAVSDQVQPNDKKGDGDNDGDDQGHAVVISQIAVVPTGNPGGADLIALTGNHVQAGLGGQVLTPTGGAMPTFTWSGADIPRQFANSPLFVGDLDGDGTEDRELFTITSRKQGGTQTYAAVDMFLYIDEQEGGGDGEEKEAHGESIIGDY